jgi:GT2 family glycosyltransferase
MISLRMAAAQVSRLAAVIVNYQTPAATLAAAQSLLASQRRVEELIIVDNGSNDDSEDWLRRELPTATILQTGRNLGFAFGCNVGLRIARERNVAAVLLLNSDAQVAPDCIGHLEGAVSADDSVGVASPVLVSARDFRTVEEVGVTLSESTGRMFQRDRGQPFERVRFEGSRAVDAVSGCVMFITRLALDRVGLLAEDYFFSFEDFDFCRRARAKDFRILCVGRAVAYHHGHLTIGAQSPDRLYYAARNHLLLFCRTDSRSSLIRRTARACSIVALNLTSAAIRPTSVGRVKAVKAVWLGTRDHLHERLGEIQLPKSSDQPGARPRVANGD